MLYETGGIKDKTEKWIERNEYVFEVFTLE